MALELKRLLLALGLAVCCLSAIPLVVWGLSVTVIEHHEAVESGRQLFIISSSHGYLPGVLLGLAVLAAWAVAMMIFDMGKTRSAARTVESQKYATYGMVAALVLTFAGHYIVTAYWEHKAEKSGYQKCPPMTLLMNHLTYTAWVKDADICYDSNIRRIVVNGSPQEAIRVQERIEAQQRLDTQRQLN